MKRAVGEMIHNTAPFINITFTEEKYLIEEDFFFAAEMTKERRMFYFYIVELPTPLSSVR